jgi:long-chain acyl-CoA synthetase
MSLNLAVLLEESAKAHPTKPALVLGEHTLSYAELLGASRKFANALEGLGIRPGEKVALMLPNVPQFAIAYFGALSLGAAVVPLNVLFKSGEVEYHLRDSDAAALVVWEGFLEEAAKGFGRVEACRELIVAEAPGGGQARKGTHGFNALLAQSAVERELAVTNPDDTAVILYTSGTTGRPKGAELTHFNLFYNAAYSADRLMDITPEDVTLAVLPLFHVFGQTCVMNATLYKGATVALVPRFEPEAALKTIQGARVTIFEGVPTMYQYLLRFPDREKYDTSSLRIGISGGAAMPVEVLRAFEEAFGITILEGYGLSETSPVACFNLSEERRKVGSIGLPIWGTRARVVDPEDREVPRGESGELVLRGHHVMKGYYKQPEATATAMRGDWFHTGDVATMDEDGFVYIVDRIKDMILRGGFNIYPRELEEALYAHPAVAECAVLGVPHPELGEEVHAVIVLKAGQSATEEELITFMRERVAAYKYPRTVELVSELPKTATGKILKRELATQARQATTPAGTGS